MTVPRSRSRDDRYDGRSEASDGYYGMFPQNPLTDVQQKPDVTSGGSPRAQIPEGAEPDVVSGPSPNLDTSAVTGKAAGGLGGMGGMAAAIPALMAYKGHLEKMMDPKSKKTAADHIQLVAPAEGGLFGKDVAAKSQKRIFDKMAPATWTGLGVRGRHA